MRAIDVSCWQSGIDYNAVKAFGIDTVIIRAGYGREMSQKDTQFENHYRDAKAAGMNVGAYWYSYADSIDDAITEAETCLSCISGKDFDLPVYYDMEESWQTAFGRSTLTSMTESFCHTIESAGYRAGVYSNVNWFSNFLNYSSLADKYSIWLAQWGTTTYSYDCDIWQYSEDGYVPGIYGDVDMNQIINENVINESDGGSGQEIYFDISMPYLAKSGYINTGEEVKTVQLLLNAMNYGDLEVDGIFGHATDQAVKKFQRSRNLDQDGIVGQDTWRYLLK